MANGVTFTEQFEAARMAGAPLLYATTADPAATISVLRAGGRWGSPPNVHPVLIQWDRAAGLRGLDDRAGAALAKLGPPEALEIARDPGAMLLLADRFPEETILFLFNLHRYWADPMVVQALWNLRDSFKQNGRTVVVLGPPTATPAELEHDMMTLDVPLPTEAEHEAEIVKLVEAKSVPLSKEDRVQAVDAVRGLSAFEAEQIVAMSLTKKGFNFPMLWTRKRSAIQQTQGLSVDDGTETLENIRGHGQLISFGRRLFEGVAPPVVIVRIDEIQQKFAGLGARGGPGDNTGVTQDQLDLMLEAMEGHRWIGMILVGPAGTGKTLFSRALGRSYRRPTLVLDFGGMKNPHVGESEAAGRTALKRIEAVAGHGGACFIATANDLEVLPAPLKNRFTLGTWFVDLPSKVERPAIWDLHQAAFKLAEQARPADDGWSGRDIRNCCETAWRLGCPLMEAATFVVPVITSDPEDIARLRALAKNRWLATSYAGAYRGPVDETPGVTAVGSATPGARRGARRIALGDDE